MPSRTIHPVLSLYASPVIALSVTVISPGVVSNLIQPTDSLHAYDGDEMFPASTPVAIVIARRKMANPAILVTFLLLNAF
jgi:hypothetical protein